MAWFKNHPEENDPDKIKELGRLAEEFSLGERSLILEGKMARTAEKIKDLTSDDIQAINSILKEYRNNNDPSPNCMPFYRDGLIFYGEDGQVVSYINICFQCGFIDTNPRYAFIYNSDQLRRLKFFFREGLGHPVE
ncbi:MAG: hypothetical protein H6581_21185 [Bacteroidia bacterium]|nr:hypothetical protein [Bacteroidia bacterium]